MNGERGPYLLAALLCKDVVLDEQGGSLHHLVSGAYEVSIGHEPGQPMEPLEIEFAIFVMLSGGDSTGGFELTISSPLFEDDQVLRMPVVFTQPHEVWSESISVERLIEHPGVYLIDVALDGRLLTRIPYHVTYRSVGYG
jgi:hypothetical protein